MTLTKLDIAEHIQNELGAGSKHARQITETLLELIKSTLESGEDLMITGLGKFCVKDKNSQRGRNPATGDGMMLSKRCVVTFCRS